MAVFAEPVRALRRAVVGAATGLALLGCSEKVRELPPPAPASPSVVVVTPAANAASTSVPDAATVLGTTNEAKRDTPSTRTNKTMSRAEESTAMPMAGQNNDHSAPLPPAKRASGP